MLTIATPKIMEIRMWTQMVNVIFMIQRIVKKSQSPINQRLILLMKATLAIRTSAPARTRATIHTKTIMIRTKVKKMILILTPTDQMKLYNLQKTCDTHILLHDPGYMIEVIIFSNENV